MKIFQKRKANVLLLGVAKNDSGAIRSLQKHVRKLRVFGYRIAGDIRVVWDKENERCIAFQQMTKSRA